MSYKNLEIANVHLYGESDEHDMVYVVVDEFMSLTMVEYMGGECESASNELELVEYYGDENGLLCSEEEVSQAFDNSLVESDIKLLAKLIKDKPALNEIFSSWMDLKESNGEMHEEQVNNYTYVNDVSELISRCE